MLTNRDKDGILKIQFNSLIKSGGGTGPVKPGNLIANIDLLAEKVLNPAELSER